MAETLRKICIVVNSRANYGRIKSVMRAVQNHPELELQLIVGASALLYRFGNVIDVIRGDGFEPAATVYSIVEGENPTTMAKSTGMAIIDLATQFETLKPDIVLTVADRFETMATAIAASYMNIPLAHTQGGEVTGSIDESVRHAISKLAHLHFPATDLARDNLLRMGEAPETVFMTGCPAIDVISELDLSLSADFFARYRGVGAVLDPSKPYLVVLQHPVTTEFGQGFQQIRQTLDAVIALDMQTVWLWPNVDAGSDDVSKGLRVHREHHGDGNIHFNLSQPLGAEREPFLARWGEVNAAVHDLVVSLGGSISAEHGIGQLKVAENARFKPPVELEMMRSVKQALDPQGLMNPGKVLG